MICVVEGAVGAGKTYYTVKMCADHLRNGGIVATNLDLHRDKFEHLVGRRLSSKQFLQITSDTDPATIPRGDLRGHGKRKVLVVLDEALNWFSSSASRDDSLKGPWSRWLRQSDKLGQQVVFVAQAFDRSAKWIRELAQLLYSVRRFGQMRWLGIPIGRLLGLGSVCVAVVYDLTLQQRTGAEFYVLRPEVWSCYETSVLYGFDASSNAYDGVLIYPPHPFPSAPVALLSVWVVWGLLRVLLA